MSGRQEIERVWDAPLSTVWELWTTPQGLGSWWGPKGYSVEVAEMDLRVGGSFRYTMRAVSPGSIASMERMGRPTSWEVSATYTVMEPPYRLAYDSPFGSDKLMTSVEFSEVEGGTKMVLVIDATKPEMTGGAAMGWRSALESFAERLAQ